MQRNLIQHINPNPIPNPRNSRFYREIRFLSPATKSFLDNRVMFLASLQTFLIHHNCVSAQQLTFLLTRNKKIPKQSHHPPPLNLSPNPNTHANTHTYTHLFQNMPKDKYASQLHRTCSRRKRAESSFCCLSVSGAASF